MKERYNILIIGAGNIAARFDTPDSEEILTHAHGFSKFDQFNLLGFVDSNYEKAKEASELWGGKPYKSIEDAADGNKIHVASVAVPDEYHFEILKKLSELDIELVFAEKPLTKRLNEAQEIKKIYESKGIPILINYSRRFVPEFEKIKNEIKNGTYGDYLTGSGYYGKGILHNGSHAVDFLRYLLSDIKQTKTVSYDYDFFKDDPSASVILRFNNNKYFYLQNVNCNKYTIFEIELAFEKARIRFIDSGFSYEIYEVSEDKKFSGYKKLYKVKDEYSSLGKAMYYAAENIYLYLSGKGNLKCDIRDGYEVIRICNNIANEKEIEEDV